MSKLYISKKDLHKRMKKDLKWLFYDYGFDKTKTEKIIKKFGVKFLKESIESETNE
jgi:hypothetical protein